jgi:hypothetical protein
LRVIWAVSCRSYDLHDDGTAEIEGAGVDTFWVETLPAELQLNVLLKLGLLEGEESELKIDLRGSGMTLLGTLDRSIRAQPQSGHQAGHEVVSLRPTLFRILAESEGIHSVEIYTDNRFQDAMYFGVRLGSPPE